ncbi:MAG: RNA-binding cell elongation regulator Jag/EloR [Lachnospiraceae bacterium]|nr:RNA-binding cell elongation regulator Jag/EloR [Lachnospiraceae bacterium]
MDSIRVEAKTVADAVTEASIQLGTSSDNIEYTVISEGSRGFFGIGGKKAVIDARKKFTDDDLMKEVFGSSDKPEKAKREPKKEVRKEEVRKETKNDFKKDFKKEFKKEVRTETPQKKEAAPEMAAEPKKEERREPKKEFTREKREFRESSKEKKPEAETASAPEQAETEPKTPRVPADPEEAKRRAVDFLKEMFRLMEMNVEIRAEFAEDTLSVEIEGEDMGLLIGKRGQTLDSLQYLTSLVVNKGKASYVRVKLDTEDYRSRRKATLENLAKNIAMKVKKTRRPVFLEPMNPYERRIIHSALQNDPYVTTHSEGDEPNRRVVVTPKKGRSEGRPQERSGYRQRRPRPEGSYRTRREHEAFPQPQETAPAETQAEAPQE